MTVQTLPEAAVAYRFGGAVLEIETSHQPLLDEFASAYGDSRVAPAILPAKCGAGNPAGEREPAGRIAGATLRCEARFDAPNLTLRFEVDAQIPHLCDIALSLIRPRAVLQHFQPRELENGWRVIANEQDENAPLLKANDREAVIDLRQEPDEFVLNFIVAVAQLAQESVLFVHGGGIVIGGRGTLVVGRSGTGKSTTTAAVACRGHALLGDETVGIDTETREILAFRRTIKIRPGVRPREIVDRLGRMQHDTRFDANGLECAWVRGDELFPGVDVPWSAPLSAVFFLRSFSDRAAAEPFVPTLQHLHDLQAMTMSLSAVATWPLSPAHRLIRFVRAIDVFTKSRCYFLDLGTPDETAELIERTVTESC
jgi:hypothetical protein